MSEKPYRPPLGWLLLGLAYGIIVGHWIAFGVLIPPGRSFQYGERLAFTFLGCMFAGVVIAAVLERQLQRLSIHYAWLSWFLVAAVYFLVFGLPIMNAARE